MTKITGNN